MTTVSGVQITLWDSVIFDANASLPMAIKQQAWHPEFPIVIQIDECQWHIDLDRASQIAAAADSASRAIGDAERNNVAPTPKAYISHNLETNIGRSLFEIATIGAFPFLSLRWED